MKNIFRFTAILALLAGVCFGQGTAGGLTVQVQNAGTPIGTYKKWLVLNCVAGLSCAMSNGVLGITVTGAATALDTITNPTGNTAIDMSSHTANFNFTGNYGASWAYSISSSTGANAAAGYLFEVNAGGTSNKVASLTAGANGITIDHTGALSATGTGSIDATKLTGNLPAISGASLSAIPTKYSQGSCTELWGGSGTSFALTSGDDAIANNACYNDSGVTRTITAVKCRSDAASNSVTVNPTFGAAGTGTAILTGALTCGNSYAYSATGTLDTGAHIAWSTGTGIDPVMAGTLTGSTSIAMIVEYTY